jgi:hypothetical protein
MKETNYRSYRLRSKFKGASADIAGSAGSAAHASTVEVCANIASSTRQSET